MKAYFYLILLFSLLLFSCEEEIVHLPPSPVMEHDNIAVILSDYIKVYKLPAEDSAISFFLRRGDIIRVRGTAFAGTGKQFEIDHDSRSGWIHDDEIRFVQTMDQARRLITILE